MGTMIGRVDRLEADDEKKDDDEEVVEALFEHSKLYPCRNKIYLSIKLFFQFTMF